MDKATPEDKSRTERTEKENVQIINAFAEKLLSGCRNEPSEFNEIFENNFWEILA